MSLLERLQKEKNTEAPDNKVQKVKKNTTIVKEDPFEDIKAKIQ